jgi:hypothetical protein
MQQQQIE